MLCLYKLTTQNKGGRTLMYFKKSIFISLATVILCIVIFNIPVFAADYNDGLPVPEPPTQKSVSYLYPVSVKETQDESGRRELIKTYELAPNEKPDNISRSPFTRGDWLYQLTDITKQETNSIDTRNYTETITLNTDTNDTGTILKQLALTMEYTDNDGYVGVLSLDISSIKVETAGTKSNAYTVTATREYPNLSSNDTSVIPKSVTENGRTLTLSNVDWKTQNYVTIDYDSIPDSYTAVVTYTATAYKTVVTGYITTAEYSGILKRDITGKTVYKAYFTGTQIIVPEETETQPTIEPETETETEVIDEDVEPTEETESKIAWIPENIGSYIPLIITGLTGTGLGGGLMFLYKNKKSKKGVK
jgi:hypothetical protein